MKMRKLAANTHKIIIWSLFIGVILGIFLSAQAAYGWWDASWSYREKLIFDNSSQTESLTDFPVLIKLTTSTINYSDVGNADGTDLRFIDSDDSTELKYHIEKWNSSGDSFIWVKVPQIDESSNTDFIYMYYGNDGAADVQDSTNTFSNNYTAVWHMDEASWNGTPDEVDDSTSYNNDGTAVGDATTTTAGQMNGGGTFDGNGDYVEVPDSASLDVTDLTINAWANSSDFTPSDYLRSYNRIVVSKSDGKVGYQLGLNNENKPYFGFGGIKENYVVKKNNVQPAPTDSGEKSTDGRLPAGSSGRGDDKYMTRPVVIKDGSTYKMWYHAKPWVDNLFRIYYATSPDGLEWTKQNNDTPGTCDSNGPCPYGDGRLGLGTDGRGDDHDVNYCTVIKEGSTYKMWYSGHDGTNYRIYYATSDDGLTWTKYDNTLPGTTQNTGQTSTNGRLYLGTDGKGDDLHTYTPIVIKDGSTYKMWYSGHDGTYVRTFYATSPDGLTWTKQNNDIPGTCDSNGPCPYGDGRLGRGTAGKADEKHACYPYVIKDGSTYIMWYTAGEPTNNERMVCCATSPDGLTWTKLNNVIPAPSSTTSTDGQVPLGASGNDTYCAYSCSALKDGSTYKIYYIGDEGVAMDCFFLATIETGVTSSNAVASELTMLSGVADTTADTIKLYVNGVLDSSNTTTVNSIDNSEKLRIGELLNGTLDEVRIATTARSADWIKAQYKSMNDTFIDQPDTVSPAAITTLTALTGELVGAIDLSWVSPGDNGSYGIIESGEFRIQYTTSSSFNSWSSTATPPSYAPRTTKSINNLEPGTTVYYTLQSLTAGDTYYIRIWTGDEVPNWSEISNGATTWAAVSTDETAPSAITNLSALTGTLSGEIDLTWTAPGDDGTVGNNHLLAYYTLKYATYAVTGSTDTWWDNAFTYQQSWTVQAQGTTESKILKGFTPGVTYYFAMKTTDHPGNVSAIDDNAPAGGDPQAQAMAKEFESEVIYNFSDYLTQGHQAWEKNDADVSYPIPHPIPSETEFWADATEPNYSDIVDDNGQYAESSSRNNKTHRFVFKVNYIVNLSSFTVLWNGVMQDNSQYYLEIWNVQSLSWTNLVSGQATGGSDFTVSSTVVTNPSNYFTEDNKLEMVIWAQHVGGGGEYLWTDYVELKLYFSPDMVKPSAIANLSALTGDNAGQIKLTWTAPGDDGESGNNGPGAYYTLRYGTFSVVGTSSTTWWNHGSVDTYQQSWSVNAQGTTENYTINGLDEGKEYYFQIRTTDDNNNQSDIDTKGGSGSTQAHATAGVQAPAGANRYWVGATNWNNTDNWSDTSGGGGGAGVPGPDDTAIFDGENITSCQIDISSTVTSVIIYSTYTATISINSGESLTTSGSFEIAGGTFTTNGELLEVGSYNQTGGIFIAGGSTVTCNGDFSVTVGTFNAGASVLVLDATGDNATFTGDGYTFNNVIFQSTDTAVRTWTLGGGTITINGDFQLKAQSSWDLTVTAITYNPDLNILGSVDYTGTGTGSESISMGNGTWTVGGNIDFSDGTVDASTSTFVLNGTSTQTLTMDGNNLNILQITKPSSDGVYFADNLTLSTFTATTADTHLYFCGGSTFTFTNMYLDGQSDTTRIQLRSLTDNATWYLTVTGSQSVEYVDVKDSNALGGDTIVALSSVDSGNNTNWDFGPPAAITNLTGLCDSGTGDVTLSWSTPGDDNWTGTLPDESKYRIDYSTDSTKQWDKDDYEVWIPTNGVAPHTEVSYKITGLTGDTTWYFQIWTRDEVPTNWSELSNGATVWVNPVLSVSISTGTYDFGEIPLSASTHTVSIITVTNDGNVNETYSLKISSVTLYDNSPSLWKSTDTTTGHNRFIFYAIFHGVQVSTSNFDSDDYVIDENRTSTADWFSDNDGGGDKQTGINVPKGDDRKLWFRLDMPTSTTTGKEEKITVTITAEPE